MNHLRPAPQTAWRPGHLSLVDIEEIQPAGNCYWNHVEQAEWIGISECDRVFTLGTVRVWELSYWITADEWDLFDLDGLAEAWAVGPEPPPVIAVRPECGRLMGLDGWHRLNAAVQVGREIIPAWLAHQANDASRDS